MSYIIFCHNYSDRLVGPTRPAHTRPHPWKTVMNKCIVISSSFILFSVHYISLSLYLRLDICANYRNSQKQAPFPTTFRGFCDLGCQFFFSGTQTRHIPFACCTSLFVSIVSLPSVILVVARYLTAVCCAVCRESAGDQLHAFVQLPVPLPRDCGLQRPGRGGDQ